MTAFIATSPIETMPFGKYRGVSLAMVGRNDPRYLAWVASDACQAAGPELKEACRVVLGIAPVAPGDRSGEDSRMAAELAAARAEIGRLEREVAELKRRVAANDVVIPGLDPIRVVIRRWFGAMSRRFHPDAGGTHEQQIVVNACYQELNSILNGGPK